MGDLSEKKLNPYSNLRMRAKKVAAGVRGKVDSDSRGEQSFRKLVGHYFMSLFTYSGKIDLAALFPANTTSPRHS